MVINLETLRSQYRDAILAIAAAHHAENVRVFGSVVRGDAREDSDVDILVHLQPKASISDLVNMDDKFSKLLGKKVEVLSDEAIHELLEPFILKEATPL